MRCLARCLLVIVASLGLRAGAADRTAETLSAVIGVAAKVQPNARSAATLGTERHGTGALIRDGVVLTIGYLVVEAESIQLTGADGRTVPATLAAYDHASGFALLKAVGTLGGKPLPLGDATSLAERDPAMVITAPAREEPTLVRVVSRRPFSGSWEYLLDAAIYTYPPVMAWSGAPLIGPHGELLGVGSLVVNDAGGQGTRSPGNVFVPIDLLTPILDELLASGRRSGPARPWLGVNADEVRGRLFVSRVSPEGPAERAGLRPGDIVLAVGGEEVASLAAFYRKVWARGPAGTGVPLRVLQGAQLKDLNIRSIDRADYFKAAQSY
jgi:S1-C subfamily serine protease